jgi:Fe-S cluster assembly scaffold protein SufB
MQSRGIALEQAKQMLIEAHIDEAFAKVENTEIRDWLKHNF